MLCNSEHECFYYPQTCPNSKEKSLTNGRHDGETLVKTSKGDVKFVKLKYLALLPKREDSVTKRKDTGPASETVKDAHSSKGKILFYYAFI